MKRQLSDIEMKAFGDDGVALVKDAVDSAWVNRLLAMVDDQMANPSKWANDANPGRSTDRLFTDRYMWR